MIKLTRPAAPAELNTQPILDSLAALRAKRTANQKWAKGDFVALWGDPAVRAALYIMHNGKCCYCERIRDNKREPDVEHFRPKAKVTYVPSHPGYWWLAYDWENLLWSCKSCNQAAKLNYFPLVDENTRVSNEGEDLAAEAPVLLNPAIDNCEAVIQYDWTQAPGLFVKIDALDGDARADKSIKLLKLNRPELMRERSEYKVTLELIAVNLVAARYMGNEDMKAASILLMKDKMSPAAQFSGFARYYFKSWGLQQYF